MLFGRVAHGFSARRQPFFVWTEFHYLNNSLRCIFTTFRLQRRSQATAHPPPHAAESVPSQRGGQRSDGAPAPSYHRPRHHAGPPRRDPRGHPGPLAVHRPGGARCALPRTPPPPRPRSMATELNSGGVSPFIHSKAPRPPLLPSAATISRTVPRPNLGLERLRDPCRSALQRPKPSRKILHAFKP